MYPNKYGRYEFLFELIGNLNRLKPSVVKLFEELHHRQEKGLIWVTGIGKVIHHLLKMEKIKIEYNIDGSISFTNQGNDPIEGASFFLPQRYIYDLLIIDGHSLTCFPALHKKTTVKDRCIINHSGLFFELNFKKFQTRILQIKTPSNNKRFLFTPKQIDLKQGLK